MHQFWHKSLFTLRKEELREKEEKKSYFRVEGKKIINNFFFNFENVIKIL